MKIKIPIPVLVLVVSLLLIGCTSLDRSAAEEPAWRGNLQEEKQVKPGDDPLLDLLYYLVSLVAPAFSGR